MWEPTKFRRIFIVVFLQMMNSVFRGVSSRVNADSVEFCLSESFNVTCPSDEVLLMTSARYGRMHAGRCIKAEFGHIGCSLDAMWKMDEACSGKQQCLFPVTNLVQMKACPDDVTSFLAVSSVCVKASSHHSRCPESGHVTLSSSSGYISLSRNSVARCPWRIVSDPLQHIVFTLYRFEKERLDRLPSAGVSGSGVAGVGSSGACPWSLVFEEGSTKVKEHGLCRISSRETVVFTSKGSVVTAYVQYRHNMALPVTYLLKYEFMGCPQIKVPPNAWVIQDENKATIKCNYSEETWFLACNENDWKGEFGNCSKNIGKEGSIHDFISGPPTPMPFGFMLAVVIGVLLGVVIGAIPLALVYICLKRKWNKQPPHNYIRDGIYFPEIQTNLTEDGASMYPALLKQSPTVVEGQLKTEEYCYGYTDPYPQIGPCMPGPNFSESDIAEPNHPQKMDGTIKTCHQLDCCHLTDCPDVMSQTVLARIGRPAGNRRLPEHVYESASFGRNCQVLGAEVNREIIPMHCKREIPVVTCKSDYLKNVIDERSQTQ